LLITITGVTITEINMHDEPNSCSKSPRTTILALVAVHWLCYLNLAHCFPAKRDRHNQSGKVVQ